MSIFEILFQFLLEPLILILETIYGFALNLGMGYGAAIIPLSLAVNFMLLPFYKRADALQTQERDAQARMEAGVKHIKAVFKGDERFMMLQTYYRQNHYRPIYGLRSLLPLALEIPFFIAAFHFLSGIKAFEGSTFGPLLNDLGAPDQLLAIDGLTVNVLPIVMTLINVISSEIYTHGAPIKEKLTLHGMALLFLVLLYNSPSALVFYWTLNNIFSLIKNLIGKSRRPKIFRNVSYSILGLISLLYGCLYSDLLYFDRFSFVILGLLLQIPALKMVVVTKCNNKTKEETKVIRDDFIFRACCIFLTLLMGALIPSATIVSSPTEFMLLSDLHSPLWYVLSASVLASGLFILWIGLFYYLSSNNIRSVFTIGALVVSGISIVNYLIFGTNNGTLLPQLQYEKSFFYTQTELTNNFEVLLLISFLLIAIYLKKRGILRVIMVAACVTVFGLSVYNAIQIQEAVPLAIKTLSQQGSEDKFFALSKKGKNVIVVTIDRAISGYLPFLFKEKPELEEQFDGFTWYPNTISYSNNTNTGSPAIYGGYDYRPDQMNARSNLLLVDKHNEALKTMPVIFSNHGFEVTVCDPPYANYQWVPDLSIFDSYPQIRKFNTESGQFRENSNSDSEKREIWKRNFYYFSLMKSSPLLLQSFFYQGGKYFDGKYIGKNSAFIQIRNGLSKATGQRDDFIDAYSALSAYPKMTKVSNSDKNTFTMLYNSTAHNLTLLQEPEYTPETVIDNTEYDTHHQDRFTNEGRTVRVESDLEMMSYQCNMAAMLKLGAWFDDLRHKGVYDNSRIIIVADHGGMMGSFSDMIFGKEKYEDAMNFNPMLMVKDFGSVGFKVNKSFMTNADTPTLAFDGVIENPISPFTGKLIDNKPKFVPKHHIFYTDWWRTNINNGTTFRSGIWMEVSSDNLFDMSSWKTTGKYEGD